MWMNQVAVKCWLGSVCLAAVLFSGAVSAAETNGRVAVLDLQRAVMTTAAAREKMKALESHREYSDALKKAESLQQQLIKKQEELQKEGSTWSADKRSSHLKDMDFMNKDYELARQKMEAEIREVTHATMKEMQPKLKKVVDDLIKEEKISLLLKAEAAWHATDEVDITAKVTQKLDAVK